MNLKLVVMIVVSFAVTQLSAQELSKAAGWSPWQPLPWSISYFTVLPGGVEFWFDANLGAQNGVVGLTGPSLTKLKRSMPRFDAQIIQGYDQPLDGRATPIISRSSVSRLQDGRHVVLAGIGPSYQGGGSELFSAMFVSKNGKAGSWKHLGPPAGEPARWLADRRKSGKPIRQEGGRLLQLADGSFRLYEQGYGVRLAILEAAQLAGPWTFRRNADGTIYDATAGLKGGNWLFPQVMPVPGGYLLTAGNAWPPKRIVVAFSTDGLAFTVVSTAVLTPQEVVPEATMLKTLRGAVLNDGQFHAVANVWDDAKKTWMTYASTIPLSALTTVPQSE